MNFCCERKGRLHLRKFLVVDVPRGKPSLLRGRDAEILGYLDIHADEIHSVNEVKTDKNSNVHNQQIQNEQLNHQNSECNAHSSACNIQGQESVRQRAQPLNKSSKIPTFDQYMLLSDVFAKVQRVNEALEKLCVEHVDKNRNLSKMLIKEKPNENSEYALIRKVWRVS